MPNLFILLFMFLAHIIDDFYLQGILANMKQKEWWVKNTDNKLYKYDYIMALIIHSISWSIMILLPAIITALIKEPILIINKLYIDTFIYIIFGINAIIHCIVDDLKANKHKINLITDQSIHLVQIFITWAICLYVLL